MFDFLDVEEVDLGKQVIDTSKWQRCFFDLEGSLTTQGDIIQLAMIFTDWDLKITGVYNSYFKNVKPISPKELSVHNISEDFLAQNAKQHFIEALEEIPLHSSKSTLFVSYTLFDVKRINEELKAYNKPLVDFGKEVLDLVPNLDNGVNAHFNAYNYGKTRGSLLIKQIDNGAIDSIYEELKQFGNFDRLSNHDALFDSVMILALCRRYLNGSYS